MRYQTAYFLCTHRLNVATSLKRRFLLCQHRKILELQFCQERKARFHLFVDTETVEGKHVSRRETHPELIV